MKKFLIFALFCSSQTFAQSKKIDTMVYNVIYRDTIIYVKHYDSVKTTNTYVRMNNWGIGPVAGAYYSPYTGFDIKIGLGLQYNLYHNFLKTTNRKKKK